MGVIQISCGGYSDKLYKNNEWGWASHMQNNKGGWACTRTMKGAGLIIAEFIKGVGLALGAKFKLAF